MRNFLIKENSYEKMPKFLMILDKEKLKVKVLYMEKLYISVEEEELEYFKRLANVNEIGLIPQIENNINTTK